MGFFVAWQAHAETSIMLVAYNRLLTNRPIVTKTASAAVLGVGGDALAQAIEHRNGSGKSSDGGAGDSCGSSSGSSSTGWYDAERGIAFSSLATFWNGPFMHYYFELMNRRLPAAGLRGLLSKTAITQVLLNPVVYLPLFFGWTAVARGLTVEQATGKARAEYWPALQATWGFFTPVNLINFALVPVPHQNTFNAVASIVYNTILSLLAGGGGKEA